MARSNFFWWNVASWLLVSCTNPAEQQNPDLAQRLAAERQDTLHPPAPTQQYLYVSAPSGLRLRKEANPLSEALTTIPFGTKLEIQDTRSSTIFTAEGKPGKMIGTTYNNQRGYVFDGFTSIAQATKQALPPGKYCFQSQNAGGYEYLQFSLDPTGLSDGSGNGHNASGETSWTTTFTGFFDPNGHLLVKMIVENGSGKQAARLETWKIVDTTSLVAERPQGKPLEFKKADCKVTGY
jgi:hypothetical protein